MSTVGLSQIISGKPSYPSLEKISAALDVPIWQLFISPKDAIPKEDKDTITCPNCGKKFKMEDSHIPDHENIRG